MAHSDNPLITLKAGEFSALVSRQGATLTRLQLGARDLILGLFADADPALDNFYAGAIVGPIANRIAQGRLKIDQTAYQMELNENGVTSLHSGTDGLHRCIWNVQTQSASHVTLACHLPDGYSGLPGKRDISVTYALDPTGLSVQITATTDKKTPINIAHHPYWALETDQAKTQLQINAVTYLPIKDDGIPTGLIASVANSPFDFRVPTELGQSSQLDHNWCLSHTKSTKPRHVASLKSSDGLRLDISTTEVGLQIFTGSGLPKLDPAKCQGPEIKPYSGIAVEAQGWPDAPNHPDFPSVMLDKGDTYQQLTQYRFSQ
jgi:aldose 1-epimerase